MDESIASRGGGVDPRRAFGDRRGALRGSGSVSPGAAWSANISSTGTISGGSLMNCSSPSTSRVSLANAFRRSFDSALATVRWKFFNALVPASAPQRASICVGVELGVPEIEVGHGGERSHRVAVRLRGRAATMRGACPFVEPAVAPGDIEAGGQPLDVPFERAGHVSSKSLTSKTSDRSAEAKPPKFARCASPHSCTFKPECGAEARSAAITLAAPR